MNVPWVKSSFSFANGNCVEVAELPGGCVGIRDSRDPGGPVLRFTRAEWAAFRRGVLRGELERFVPGWPEAAPVGDRTGRPCQRSLGDHQGIAERAHPRLPRRLLPQGGGRRPGRGSGDARGRAAAPAGALRLPAAPETTPDTRSSSA